MNFTIENMLFPFLIVMLFIDISYECEVMGPRIIKIKKKVKYTNIRKLFM